MQVKTLKSGEIDYEHFQEVLITNRARPAIVNVNCGTTVKGAVDDLDRVLQILRDCGYDEDRFYIHIDGALFGMMVSKYHLIPLPEGRDANCAALSGASLCEGCRDRPPRSLLIRSLT